MLTLVGQLSTSSHGQAVIPPCRPITSRTSLVVLGNGSSELVDLAADMVGSVEWETPPDDERAEQVIALDIDAEGRALVTDRMVQQCARGAAPRRSVLHQACDLLAPPCKADSTACAGCAGCAALPSGVADHVMLLDKGVLDWFLCFPEEQAASYLCNLGHYALRWATAAQRPASPASPRVAFALATIRDVELVSSVGSAVETVLGWRPMNSLPARLAEGCVGCLWVVPTTGTWAAQLGTAAGLAAAVSSLAAELRRATAAHVGAHLSRSLAALQDSCFLFPCTLSSLYDAVVGGELREEYGLNEFCSDLVHDGAVQAPGGGYSIKDAVVEDVVSAVAICKRLYGAGAEEAHDDDGDVRAPGE